MLVFESVRMALLLPEEEVYCEEEAGKYDVMLD